jgi:uncharacterized membrane protein
MNDLIENKSRLYVYFLFFAAAIEFVIFVYLGFLRPFWLDEVLTFQIIHENSLFDIIRKLYSGADTNLPFYFVILKAFAYLFGESDFALKSFSLLCTTVSFLFIYFIVRQFISERYKVFPLFLFLLVVPITSTYLFVEVRTYAFWFMLETIFLYLYLRYNNKRRNVFLLLLFVLSLALIYTHYFSFYFLAVFGIVELVRPKKDIRFLLMLILSFVSFIPWLPALIRQMNIGKMHVWHEQPTLNAIFIQYYILIGKVGIILLIAALIRLIIGIKKDENKTLFLFALLLTILPLVNIVLAKFSLTVHTPRYFVTSLLGIILLFTLIIEQMKFTKTLYFIAILLSLWGGYRLYFYYIYVENKINDLKEHLEYNLQKTKIVCESSKDFYPLWYYSLKKDKQINFVFLLDSLTYTSEIANKGQIFDYFLIKNYMNFYDIKGVHFYEDFVNRYKEFYFIKREGLLLKSRFRPEKGFTTKKLGDNLYFIRKKKKI